MAKKRKNKTANLINKKIELLYKKTPNIYAYLEKNGVPSNIAKAAQQMLVNFITDDSYAKIIFKSEELVFSYEEKLEIAYEDLLNAFGRFIDTLDG